jgi:hypothetical protein
MGLSPVVDVAVNRAVALIESLIARLQTDDAPSHSTPMSL